MLGTVLGPLVARVKVLLAARAVQELEADFLAGGSGRGPALDRLAAAWQADGLDGPADEVRRRSRVLTAPAGVAGGQAPPPVPPALPGPGRKPRRA